MSWGNYDLVVNSKFQPFSFERYIQPYQMYGEAYKEVENALGELATKASVWEEMANEQTDPYAYKMYKTYANDLEEKAGQLAREGLNAASRRDMLNMRTRYSKEITPIEQAYTARQKQAEQQQQALLQDPTLMLSRRAATTSLDDYIRNPQLAYESYSGKLITAQAASAASALAKEMQENPRKWRSILGNSYYETIMQKGFSSDAVLQAIQDNPNAAPQLTRIIEDAVNSSGISNWGDQATIARAIEYAKQGLWSAVGETQYQTLQNPEYLNPLQRAQMKNLKGDSPKGSLALNPSNIYSSRKLSEDEKKYRENMNKYSKYFSNENGQWELTYAGWKEYHRKKYVQRSQGASSPSTGLPVTQGQYVDSDFKRFIDELGGKGAISSDNFGPNQSVNVGRLWGKYAENSPAAKTAKYDAMKTTEYIYDVPQSPTYQQDYKAKLSRAIGSNAEFTEVDYDSKSNQWIPTGETLSFADFDTDDYNITARAPSELGTTLFIKKKGEKAKRYLAPPGINTTAEGGRDQAISEMLITQRMLQLPNLTPQQRKKLEEHYDNLAQQQIMFESQLDLTNQTSTQSINPYYIP